MRLRIKDGRSRSHGARLRANAERLSAFISQFNLRGGKVEIGKTVEGKHVRVHRYRSAIRVTDLTDAGKRGKQVRQFALYDLDMTRDKTVQQNVEKFAAGVEKATYDQALQWAHMIAKDSTQRGGGTVKVENKTIKAVDVMPAGFKPFDITTPHVRIRSDWEGFSIRDLGDKANEPTCIQRGKKSIKQFYRWLKDNQSKIKSMTFRDFTQELKRNKIDFHQYCAMD